MATRLILCSLLLSACAAFSAARPATAEVPVRTGAELNSETICAQGTYSLPCPKVIWCPAAKCGVGIPRADGFLEIVYSSEASMYGTRRRPVQSGSPMTLQNIAGKVIVFEWTDSGATGTPGADLEIKSILYVIMPPQGTG